MRVKKHLLKYPYFWEDVPRLFPNCGGRVPPSPLSAPMDFWVNAFYVTMALLKCEVTLSETCNAHIDCAYSPSCLTYKLQKTMSLSQCVSELTGCAYVIIDRES